ncbi:MAG: lipocalin family protein [Bacteroidota bacterium]
MKKIRLTACIALSFLLIASCENKAKEKLTGVWKLEIMDINNTPLQGSSFGRWLWEFNEEGGYLINVDGAVEKGTYKVDKDKLTLKSITQKERPDQVFTIAKLDSANMNLVSATDKNTTSLTFIKMESEDVAEKD